MRLHRLVLTDVKGVSHRDLSFPEHGVVVLQGPNEVGKSTLLEAFDRLLDPRSKASSRSARVKELQPVGRDVGPRVEAEFSVGAYRVRFAKQWLRHPATTLEVLAPRREQLSGSAAQERMDAILDEALDRSLWDALRFAQAAEAVREGLADSGVLTRALDGASGADAHAEGGDALLERVEREFLRYHTPTGRPSGELRRSLHAATTARDEAVLAHQRLEETRTLLERHDELERRARELADQRPALLRAVEQARTEEAEVTELVAARDDAMNRLEQARERSVRAGVEQRERAEAAAAVDRAEAEAERLRGAMAEAAEQVVGLEERRDGLADAETRARAAAEAAREVVSQARADVDLLRDRAEAEALEHTVAQAEEAATAVRRLEQRLERLPVTPQLLRRIEEADHELRVLRAQHQAASAVVRLEGLGRQEVVVDGERFDLEPASVESRTLTDELVVEVPGRVRISVRPAAEDRDRGVALTRAETDLRELLRQAGAEDVGRARQRGEERVVVEQELDRHGRVLADLGGPEGLARTRTVLEGLRAELAATLASRPTDRPLPADLAQARAVVRAAGEAAERAREDGAAATMALRGAERDLETVQRRREHLSGSLETLHRHLTQVREELGRARTVRPDEDLEAAVARTAADYARVEAVASEARRALAAAQAEEVLARLETVSRRLSSHDDVAHSVREDLVAIRAQVELTSGEGRQEVYDRAVAVFLQARDELEVVDRRARAARQLRDTLLRHREAAHDAYVRPFTAALERLGRQVYGPSFAVEVDGQLTIMARHLDGTLVPFEQLSGGAKEQLGILTRLAVASLVDPDEGVPVIIDDALGYTDPDRLARVGSVFAGPSERAQVILLTCTPDRYAQIPGAHTIELTA